MADSVFMVLSVSSLLLSENPLMLGSNLASLQDAANTTPLTLSVPLIPQPFAGLMLNDRNIGIQLISPGKAETFSLLHLYTIQEVKQLN